MNGSKPKNKYLRWAFLSVLLILIAVILEFSISNYRTLFIQKDQYVMDVNGFADSSEEVVSLQKDKNRSFTIKNPPSNIFAIKIDSQCVAEEQFMEPMKVIVQAYDVKRGNTLSTVQTFYIAPGSAEVTSKTAWVDVEIPEGTDITLAFYDPYSDAEITSITLNPSDAFVRFNAARFFAIAAVLFLIAAIKVLRLGSLIFDHKNIKHKAAVLVSLLLCVILVLSFTAKIGGDRTPIAYPLEQKVNQYNPYVQQTDAFLKGQLHIDYPVSEELLALENPYDYDARSGVYYLYDRAMYDGKYYSYFGIAPILNVYLPHYALLGSLPGEGTVTQFYTLIATVFSCLFLLEYVVQFKRRIPLPMLILSIFALPLVSNILLISRGYNRFYYTAVLAGMAYLAAFLFFILKAVNAKGKVQRPVFFVLAGLSYALLFLSRLNMALLTAFIVVPIVVFCVILRRPALDRDSVAAVPYNQPEGSWFNRNLPVFIDLLSLGACVVAAFAFSFWFNNARFGSALEFGTNYQLTISDVSKNKLSLMALPDSTYHYFFQPLNISSQFPNFSFLYSKLNTYGAYVYVDANFGLFSIPVMFALALIIPLLKSKEKTLFAKLLAVSLLTGCLAVSWMNFCIGGVIFRYMSDMTLLCALGAFMLLFSFSTKMDAGGREVSGIYNAVVYVLVIISVYVCLNLLLQVNGNLAKYPAEDFIWITEFLGY